MTLLYKSMLLSVSAFQLSVAETEMKLLCNWYLFIFKFIFARGDTISSTLFLQPEEVSLLGVLIFPLHWLFYSCSLPSSPQTSPMRTIMAKGSSEWSTIQVIKKNYQAFPSHSAWLHIGNSYSRRKLKPTKSRHVYTFEDLPVAQLSHLSSFA